MWCCWGPSWGWLRNVGRGCWGLGLGAIGRGLGSIDMLEDKLGVPLFHFINGILEGEKLHVVAGRDGSAMMDHCGPIAIDTNIVMPYLVLTKHCVVLDRAMLTERLVGQVWGGEGSTGLTAVGSRGERWWNASKEPRGVTVQTATTLLVVASVWWHSLSCVVGRENFGDACGWGISSGGD